MKKKEKVFWHRVVIMSQGLADVAEKYLKKGSKVYIEGQLQTRKWTDKDGKEQYTTEVVLQNFNSNLVLLDKGDNASEQSSQVEQSCYDDLDDSVPF